MEFTDLFEEFDLKGKLLMPGMTRRFSAVPWESHQEFEGVELKRLITSEQTGGQFSYYLVRIAPNRKIGSHVHREQLETHEVIAGSGSCINNGAKLCYEPGVISMFLNNSPHEVMAGENGLYLFAKFIPA